MNDWQMVKLTEVIHQEKARETERDGQRNRERRPDELIDKQTAGETSVEGEETSKDRRRGLTTERRPDGRREGKKD